jgi:hypothetical protein
VYRNVAASPAIPRYTTCMSANRNVLLIGFDPHAFPSTTPASATPRFAIGQQRFEAQGIPAELYLVQPDASAE